MKKLLENKIARNMITKLRKIVFEILCVNHDELQGGMFYIFSVIF